VKLYDAALCPYCARARIALAEKDLAYERVDIDLRDRPAWLSELNATGRVPVLDDGFVLPESAVIMEYLEERYPGQALLPEDRVARAEARLLVYRFDDNLGRDYYAFRRGDENELPRRLEELRVGQSLFADIAYAPWVMRLQVNLGVALPERLETWLDGLAQRPSIAAELELVRSL
jgi:RNA polymerase-associated protein